MLAPESRVLLTDALRPPAGYGVDLAVGTTYSLNLLSLLLAPMTFALDDTLGATDFERADPVRLLEAVRRYADRTTVFCQAGGIDVPSNYRSILTFIEDSVVEVVAPTEGALFHPKVWALRFVNEDGHYLHRGVVLSRNLTMDRSWDTALVLDEDPSGTIDAAPLADFVSALPGITLRPLDDERQADIDDLVRTLRGVRLAPPAPFTGGELLPIGLDGNQVWPFPATAQRTLAISPFLSPGALATFGRISTDRTLISRLEWLERMGSDALDGWKVNVLQRLAEVEAGEEIGPAEPELSEVLGAREGLHAKTYVIDLPGSLSQVVTGSANLTSAPWGRNVEFGTLLTGRTADCGVRRVLDGTDAEPGLLRMLESVTIESEEGIDDPQVGTTYQIEAFHRSLAERGLTLNVVANEGDSCRVELTLDVPDSAPGDTVVWIGSLPRDGHARALAPHLEWTIASDNVTPFVAFETTAGEGASRVTARCVIKAELTGDVGDRRKNALTTVLKNKHDVLRYLVFLLGDPAYDALAAELAGVGDGGTWNAGPSGWSADIALFEPLVRATGRDEGALARISSAIDELKDATGGADLLPDGFEDLWDVVWTVHQERRK